MDSVTISTKIEMLCELAHNRVFYDNNLDDNGDYTEKGQDLFNEWYDYYEDILLSHLKEDKMEEEIPMPVYYIINDEATKEKVYDFEEMADELGQRIKDTLKSNVVVIIEEIGEE